MDISKLLLSWITFGIVCWWTGIWYYYGFILPEYNEQKIALEKQKIDSELHQRLVEEQRIDKQQKEKHCKDDVKTMIDMQLQFIDVCTINAWKTLDDWDQKIKCSKRQDIKEIEEKRILKQLECKEFLPLMK